MELRIEIRVLDDDWNTLSARNVTLQAFDDKDLADVAADMHAGLGQLIQRTLAEAAKEAAPED
jgi:hypothetical protein